MEHNNTKTKERKNFDNGYRREDDIENPCGSFSWFNVKELSLPRKIGIQVRIKNTSMYSVGT